MKTAHWATVGLLLATISGFGQPPVRTSIAPDGYELTDRGQNFLRFSRVTLATNALGTVTAARTNSITQLSTGVSRWEAGRWVDSAPQLIATNKGVLGVGAPHSVLFSDDLVTSITLSNGKPFKSRILGLAYHSVTTGTNLLIAELKEAVPAPQIVGSNQVLYPDAFTDFRVDVRYSYTAAGVEQDLILREKPPRPEAF